MKLLKFFTALLLTLTIFIPLSCSKTNAVVQEEVAREEVLLAENVEDQIVEEEAEQKKVVKKEIKQEKEYSIIGSWMPEMGMGIGFIFFNETQCVIDSLGIGEFKIGTYTYNPKTSLIDIHSEIATGMGGSGKFVDETVTVNSINQNEISLTFMNQNTNKMETITLKKEKKDLESELNYYSSCLENQGPQL